jgi:sugar/nucleoside kinase (ribokinase family)
MRGGARRAPAALVIGDVMTDVVVRPEGPMALGADRRATIREGPGGSGPNQAAWLAAFGVRTIFAGRAGAADVAHHAASLAAFGVEPCLAADPGLPTGRVVALIAPDGERSFFTDRGANDGLCRADLPDGLLDSVDLVHVSGYALFTETPRDAVLNLLAESARRKIPFAVDPASHSFLGEVGAKRFLECTEAAAICFPNEAEAAVLAGTSDPDAQLETLSRIYETVVIKRGAAGAIAASGRSQWSAKAASVQPLDTSGAGDAFAAAYLAAWLAGEGGEKCLRRAVAAGSRVVTQLGARPQNLTVR